MLVGWNPACVFLAPMLTDENPEDFFPRFRDCWLSDDGERIVIYTRVGGGNRSDPYDEDYDPDWDFGEGKLYEMPNFVRTYDDAWDSTYGYYEFSVPDEWRLDFELVKEHRLSELSDAYVERMQGCYPKLDIRGEIAKLSKKEVD